MASSGERRMLFDTRGKRRHVIRVVYAILALLMGASLFLVVGPFNLGELFGNSAGTNSAAEALEEQAERIEKRLAQDPQDEQLLLALTRARINAGNSQIEPVAAGEIATVPASAHQDFEAGLESWSRYLKQTNEPSVTVAQLIAVSFFKLAEASTTVPEADENVSQATKAQAIATQERPSIGTLSTLGIYQYFNGEYAAGDKTTKQAAAEAPSKAEAKNIEKQLAEYRKRSKPFQKQKKENAKLERQIGKESLQSPFGGFGGAPAGE